jgi:hypothetical protein
MALTIHEQIDNDRGRRKKYWSKIPTYRLYAAGEQQFKLPPKIKEILEGLTEHEFQDNVCGQIIAEARDRCTFEGWAVSGPKEDKDPSEEPPKPPVIPGVPNPPPPKVVPSPESQAADKVEQFLSDLYATCNVDRRSGEVHYDAFRDADTFVCLEWDAGEKREDMRRDQAWDGNSGTYMAYGDNDRPKYAVRQWVEDTEEKWWRKNIYWPDRIERYVSKDMGTSWQRNPLPIKDEFGKQVGVEAWPVPWLDDEGQPMGIPVIHFLNSGKGELLYGTSELAGGVLGAQDHLTSMQYDMAGGSRMTAFQIYTAVGVALNTKLNVGAGELWIADKPDAAFGVLPPGDMSQIISVYMLKLQRLSQMTRTPYHIITGGDWPSGEALMRAEQPAIGKAESQIKRLKDCWVQVAHMAIKIHNRFGSGPKLATDPKVARITARFASPDRRDPLSRSAIVANIREDVSPQERLRIMGYPPDRVNAIMEEMDAHAEKGMERTADAMARGLGPGGLPGRGPGGTGGPPPKPGQPPAPGPPK